MNAEMAAYYASKVRLTVLSIEEIERGLARRSKEN